MTSSRDSEIIELWLAKQSSPHTRSCYRRDAQLILSYSTKSLKDITLTDLQGFAQSLVEAGLAPISRARTLAAIKSLFGFCQRMRYIASNPAAELALPSYENRLAERIVGEQDVQRMLETAETARDRVLLALLYAAGLRVSEACGLLWRNVRPRGEAGQITVFGKNGRTRSIALNTGIWARLAALRGTAGPEAPVFPSRTGKRLDRGRVRVILRRAAKQAGVTEPVTRAEFLAGRCRCVVSTTALAMGVNLPATHVFVRDTTFFGFGKLTSHELVQILGRAGRGDRAGIGAVLLRPGDGWGGEELSVALRDQVLPTLRSSFDQTLSRGRAEGKERGEGVAISAATLVATCLARAADAGLDSAGLSLLLGNTLGGRTLVSRLDAAINWLTDPSRVIAYRDKKERLHLTVLGKAGVRTMLPLPHIAGLGQMVRDLISLDPQAKLLARWSALDHLFVSSLMSDRAPKLKRFSESLADQLDSWFESRPVAEKSLLFAEWVTGTAEMTKADELWGSLGLTRTPAASARKKAYVAMFAAAVLDERSRGVSLIDIERRWGVAGLDGAEESWRDTVIWLVSGHAALFEVRAFYHHLSEYCSDEQIRATKRALGRIRGQAYDLIERLKYCSPLGPLMRGVRSVLRDSKEPTLGIGTIRKIEAAGISTFEEIAVKEIEDLVSIGVQRRFAKQIKAYLRRRLS